LPSFLEVLAYFDFGFDDRALPPGLLALDLLFGRRGLAAFLRGLAAFRRGLDALLRALFGI
jgi:hypothetical protein